MVPSSGGHGRKVGVCTSIRNSPNVVVVGHDTLVEGCAIYVTIKWYQCIIGILNVHAPNLSTERPFFAGDFNMTLYKEDKVGGMQMVEHGSDLVSWDLLMGQIR